jgi:hypothetical protein
MRTGSLAFLVSQFSKTEFSNSATCNQPVWVLVYNSSSVALVGLTCFPSTVEGLWNTSTKGDTMQSTPF